MDNEVVLDMRNFGFIDDDDDDSNILNVQGIQEFDYIHTTSIIFPENVKIIPESAFQSFSNLRKVYIPASVECIEENAFAYCTKLESIEFEDKQGDPDLFIGEEAFINAGIKNKKPIPSIIIPNRCEWIDHNSFKNVNTSIISIPIFEITFDSFESYRSSHPLYLFIRLDLDDEDNERDDIKIALNSFNNKEVLCFFNVFDRDPNNPKTSEVFIKNNEEIFKPTTFTKLSEYKYKVEFEGLDLRGLRIHNFNFSDKTFDDCVLIANTFDNVEFNNCSFKNTVFLDEKDPFYENTYYNKLIFENCKFSNANLNDVKFWECQFLKNIDLTIKDHFFENTKFNKNTDFLGNCTINDEMIRYDSDFNILNCKLSSLPKNVIKYYYEYFQTIKTPVYKNMEDPLRIITAYLHPTNLEELEEIYKIQNTVKEPESIIFVGFFF